MKKIWLFILLTIIIVGGASLGVYYIPQEDYYPAATSKFRFVERYHRGTYTYGMQRLNADNEWEEVIPVEYEDLSFQGAILVGSREGDDFWYLFTRDGTPIFENMSIKNYHYYNDNSAYNFYKCRFAIGVYALVDMAEGEGGVFIQDALGSSGWILTCHFGPFEQFVPGCCGYMYKDVITNKWGFQVCNYWQRGFGEQAILQEDYLLLRPEYDQIIEHYNPANVKKGAIYARKGDVWYAFNKQGKQIDISQKLLDAILYLDPLPKVKENPSYNPCRVGREEASVAFYGKY